MTDRGIVTAWAVAEDETETAKELGQHLTASDVFVKDAFADELKFCRECQESAARRKARNLRELPEGTDSRNLARTGWGLIVARQDEVRVRHHLRKLIRHRERQAGRLFKVLTYRPAETARSFLWSRIGGNPGTVNLALIPYYLLIVASPETIPYDFQYQLSVNHAVGRLWFDDLEDLEKYAQHVVEAEQRGTSLPRQTSIFSAEKVGSRGSRWMTEYLVHPLKERLEKFTDDWKIDVWEQEKSAKGTLHELLGGRKTPGLFIAACHGRRYTPDDPNQKTRQGALVCKDEDIFHAGDLGAEANLLGQIAFLFSCYGVGTPDENSFRDMPVDGILEPKIIAYKPFIAHLAQALLRQGALAVVGHIDRSWSYSFRWKFGQTTSDAVLSLEDSFKQLLRGYRLGHALRPLYRRYTALAASLAELWERQRNEHAVNDSTLAMLWTAHNDARNVIVLGDPAVYLLGRREFVAPRRGTNRPPATVDQDPDPVADPSPTTPLVTLDDDVLRYVHQKAHQLGVEPDQWVNDVLRARARNDGFEP